jgi:penicillin-insensitive murein endopeptidase
MRGAVELGRSGPGWEKMRLSRDRGWGHPRLVEFLRNLAARTSAEPRLGTLLIGDMGYARGGPFRRGHKSHQTGLDVDIWYRQVPNGARVDDGARESWDSPEMIDYDSTGFYTGFNRDWNPNEIAILRLAASDPAVQRIFVSPVIKRLICASYAGQAWVSKVRAEWGHGDHFHVRLFCQDAKCRPQAAVPSEGCGAELENEWFGSAGREHWAIELEQGGKPWKMPKDFPAECAAVLGEP